MRSLAAISVALVIGCSVSIREGQLECTTDNHCPPAWSCSGGRCFSSPRDAGSAVFDAGMDAHVDAGRDASPQADSAMPDAGPPDTGMDACVGTVPGDCSLLDQCGCASGMACGLDQTDGTARCRNAGTGRDHDACSTSENCAAGYQCAGVGICSRYCISDPDCEGGGGRCIYSYYTTTGSPMLISDVRGCSTDCDPIARTGCPAGFACYLSPSGMTVSFTMCFPIGSIAEGESCAVAEQCQAGLHCADVGGGARCWRACRYAPAASDCTASPGTSCRRPGSPIVIAGQEYGVCAAP